MILQGNQRGGAKNLALHLLKDENDHVEIHEIRGFVSDDLVNALNEAYFISKGTKAKQFLFSLSLNPPPTEKVSTETFENAIERIEKKLGLINQPRAIVFHEKENRRHAHVAWSRTFHDGQKLKAVQLSHFKLKLMDISRELYIENDWKMPRGMMNPHECNPKNFTHQQWQQAKRTRQDPRAIKQIFQDCWAVSDSKTAFAHALKSRGYTLAKEMSERLTIMQEQQQTALQARLSLIKANKSQLVQQHKNSRKILKAEQETRQIKETKNRQARYSKGLRGILDRITGKHQRIKKQNEQETLLAQKRDAQEKDQMIFKQLEQSQKLQKRADRLQDFQHSKNQNLSSDIKQYQEIKENNRDKIEFKESRQNSPTVRGFEHSH